MLSIIVLGEEHYDEESEKFYTVGDVPLELEHSLVSLSKWETIFEKPFLGGGVKTDEETMAYIKAMTLTADFPPEVFSKFSQKNFDDIDAYINKKSTGTWFVDERANPRNSEEITSELIYYWMIAFQIPFECQHWNLNRLFTLIRVCNVKNSKPKRQSRADMIADRRRLNAQRKAQFNTSG